MGSGQNLRWMLAAGFDSSFLVGWVDLQLQSLGHGPAVAGLRPAHDRLSYA